MIIVNVFCRYSFPFGRPEGAMKATLSLLERVGFMNGYMLTMFLDYR